MAKLKSSFSKQSLKKKKRKQVRKDKKMKGRDLGVHLTRKRKEKGGYYYGMIHETFPKLKDMYSQVQCTQHNVQK